MHILGNTISRSAGYCYCQYVNGSDIGLLPICIDILGNGGIGCIWDHFSRFATRSVKLESRNRKKAKKKFTGRSISTESAVFPHFELTGQNTSLTHHIKFSQLKSNRSNWVKNGWNGVETAPETNIGQYQYIGTTPSKWYRIYWANLCALIYCQYIVLIVIGSYWFQPLIKDRHAVEVGSLE